MSNHGLPAHVPDPQGQGVWEPRRDVNTGRIFWVNHTYVRCQHAAQRSL